MLGLSPLSKYPPNLAATHWVITYLCVRAGSQRVISIGPVEFIRLKQTKTWLLKRGLCSGQAYKGKMASKVTQFTLSQILLGRDGAQQGRATGTWENESSVSSMRGKCWSGFKEVGWGIPFPLALQLNLSWICPRLSRVEPLKVGWLQVKELGKWD